jgi:nitrate reductase gamma subunit
MALFAVVAVLFAASAIWWGLADEVGKTIGAAAAALALVGCFLFAYRRLGSERPRHQKST